MTADDIYSLFVGEIGIPRKEFLFDISWWEIQMIYKGYRNRFRDMWSAFRWHAYRIMGAMPYADLQKAGITSPKDLIHFPWDNEPITDDDIPTDIEMMEVQQILRDMSKRE